MSQKKTSNERLSVVLESLIDELENRDDLSEVPVKDLLLAIMTTAKLLNTVKDAEAAQDPLAQAINSLKRK